MLQLHQRILNAASIFLNRANFLATSVDAKTSLLAKLRKVSGHTFGFCREALAASGQDYDRALVWLEEEAAKRGLAKAEKLRGRSMSQGLLGLIASSKCVTAIEVNCETDFVARNQDFQSLVAWAAESAFQNISNKNEYGFHRFRDVMLQDLPIISSNGSESKLSEAIVATIASIGENISVSQAIGINLPPNDKESRLTAYCHMSTVGVKQQLRNVRFGKYIAAVRYRHLNTQQTASHSWHEQAARLSLQLCQHIVGMSPSPDLEVGKPAENPDEEKSLMRQQFMFDENITVGALLEQNEFHLDEFFRIECGQQTDVSSFDKPTTTE